MSEYRFKIGEKFKLKPSARIVWIAVSHSGGCITSFRADSELGKRTEAWIAAGKRDGYEKRFLAMSLRRRTDVDAIQGFWEHELESAVAA